MTKRNLGIGSFLALLLALAAPGAARAATLSMSATAGGGGYSVDVTVAGIEALAEPSLGAFDLDLSFDTTLLGFAGISFGSFLGGPADSIQSSSVAGGVVDFAEVSLVFPNVLLQGIQPDSFLLATLDFVVQPTTELTATLNLTQTVLSDGNGQRIAVTAAAPLTLELQGVIPEVGGMHVFALGLLVVILGQRLLPARRLAPRQGS